MAITSINAANSEHDLPVNGRKVQCPGCEAWRPDICIAKLDDGSWLGDCCITRKLRDGEAVAIQSVED